MPELPDLLYITTSLRPILTGIGVRGVSVRQPVVLRNVFDRSPHEMLSGARITGVTYHGPFIVFAFDRPAELVMNLMLAGRLHHQGAREKPPGYVCLSLELEGGFSLHLCDDKKMAKAYLVREGDHALVPGFDTQGVDILGAGFTLDLFRTVARQHSRRQVRVMINDHTVLSSIGNAYADEILFEAGIHPKTLVARLEPSGIERLYRAIGAVMAWGIDEVQRAGQPVHVKVRDHMRVRNRHGEPCPRCGTTIRREGVRGYDVFFCPRCQPATRKHFIDWSGR